MMWAWAPWILPLLCRFSLAVLPAKPENISCVFYYKKNFTCTWSPEKEASYTWYKVRRTYSYGHKNDICSPDYSASGNHASCSFLPPTITNPDNYTIQVEAQNADGIIKSDTTHWSLDAIMKTEPPEISHVKPVLGVKRMVQIKWTRPVLASVSSTLKYMLRFRTANSAHWMEVNFTEEDINRDETYNLTGLLAFTEYVVALRCVGEESMFWSGWSQEKMGTTEEEGKLLLYNSFSGCSGLEWPEPSEVLYLGIMGSHNPSLESLCISFPQGTQGTHLTPRASSLLCHAVAIEKKIIENPKSYVSKCLEQCLTNAPHGLDLWRVLRPAEADGKRPVQLLWKKAKGAPILEKSLGYNIWYFPENNTNLTETVNTTNQQLELYLGSKTYWVSAVSYNSLGESPVATLRIPAIGENSFQCIEAMQAFLTQDQLVVEWQSSVPEVDTWMVEWFSESAPKPSTFSWESVSQARNWTIQQDELKHFWCYNISVYPVLQNRVGKPYSMQAYVKEGIPSAGPVTKAENIGVKTVTITWKEIPKSQRNGFISNYTIFYQAEDGKDFSKTVNSKTLQYDLDSLTQNTSYTVQVMASTRAGGTNGTRINFKTLSASTHEVILVTSLVGGGLGLVILLVSYGLKKRDKLKHLCWPDIPNPAESSIATWCGDGLKGKVNLEFDDSMNAEDRILKSCPVPSDLIDKLVVNTDNFLEEVSTEELEKSQENILGGRNNEYVTLPGCPYCLPVSTEIPPRKSQNPCSGMLEGTYLKAKDQPLSSAQNIGPDHLCEEGAPNPYLKNSVTTREFLMSEKSPDKSKRE